MGDRGGRSCELVLGLMVEDSPLQISKIASVVTRHVKHPVR